jgi:hypothetical protein
MLVVYEDFADLRVIEDFEHFVGGSLIADAHLGNAIPLAFIGLDVSVLAFAAGADPAAGRIISVVSDQQLTDVLVRERDMAALIVLAELRMRQARLSLQ